jgi:alpha-D-ribose 1-methylphosphonate 5-triphosphate synthase subunit PhnG
MEGATAGKLGPVLKPEHEARRRWMSVLARASAAELEEAIGTLRAAGDAVPHYRLVRRPEVGMAMVRGRAGGSGRLFNLGEITMTRCTLQTADGYAGSSYVAGRDRRQAELAALLDALLQDPARQDRILRSVVDPLARAQALRRDRKVARSAPTRVDFFTVVRGEDRA